MASAGQASKQAPAWHSKEKLFKGFSWHSCNQQTRNEASALLTEVRRKRGKSAVDWEGFADLPDGFYLPWKKPAAFPAGYVWLSRALGALVSEQGQTSNWRVVGHPDGFDPDAANPTNFVAEASAPGAPRRDSHASAAGGPVPTGVAGEASRPAAAEEPRHAAATGPSNPRLRLGKKTGADTAAQAAAASATQAAKNAPTSVSATSLATTPPKPAEPSTGARSTAEAPPAAAFVARDPADAEAEPAAAAYPASKDLAVGPAPAAASPPAVALAPWDAPRAVPSCACPVLLLSARRQELEKRRSLYELGHLLGEGSFGRCYFGRRLADGQEVAVKALAPGADQLRHAWAEGYLLDRCRGHPHVPQLLDVFMGHTPNQWHLVLEYAGQNLSTFQRAQGDGLEPGASRSVVQHVALALQFLHGIGLLHADVKPRNILVQGTAAGKVWAQLGDLGSVVQADPQTRVQPAALVQTLWWRAPEVLFGAPGYDQAIDLWSLGCVLAELGGLRFQEACQEAGPTESGYARAVFQQLGTPDCPELTGLPRWPRQLPRFDRKPWPRTVVSRLGSAGQDLLEAMLGFVPALRPTAAQVADHAFVVPERFALRPPPGGEGEPCYQGARHPWNLADGTLATEVLEWLRADDALQPGSSAFRALGVDFQAARGNAKSEENRKFIMAGALSQCGTGKMCGLSLAEPLPLPRLQAWREAFLAVNAGTFEALEASAKAATRRLSPEDRGSNGDKFLELPFPQWFASCGELVFVEPGSEAEGFWAEPEHQDGGASVMHMGVTLYGRRGLVCRQGLGRPDIYLANKPGTVYLGQLTGPWHQITHEACEDTDLLEVPGLGLCGVSIMMRTALFAFNRARLRNTTPSPLPFFEVLTRCFREGLAARPLRLPSLAECLAHHA